MEGVITPEPHFIPGYTGYCPQFRFRVGATYGKLTHKLLIDPCVNHAPELIVTLPNVEPVHSELPTKEEIDVLKRREKTLDALYVHPILPNYGGFVPNLATSVGKRFMAAAESGVAKHEVLMDRYRCEKRSLQRRDVASAGRGVFEQKLRERMQPTTVYRSPLIPVKRRAEALEKQNCESYKKRHKEYSKFYTPHFMKNENAEKHIVSGYGGHIPFLMTRFGGCHRELTHNALCEFSKNYHQRRLDKWCPQDFTADSNVICPNVGHFKTYHRTMGMIPNYGGHVPGELFKFGRTFGNSTLNAKAWLEEHRMQDVDKSWTCYCNR